MKPAMAQKPTKTALWPLGIFSARMSAKPAGRKIAMDFRRFAKAVRLSPAVKLSVYGLLLRFKRCEMSHSGLPFSSFIAVASLRPLPSAVKFHVSGFTKFHRTEQTAPGINF